MKSIKRQLGFLGGLLGGLASGVLGLFGGERANDKNAEINSANNAFNAEQADLNRQFQERMSNTQYQRATQDMMAAGLNPMLGYTQGGAGTPSGSSASASQPHAMRDTITPAIQSAQVAMQVDNLREQNELLKSQQRKTDAETLTELNRPENVKAGTKNLLSSASKTEAEEHNVKLQFQKIAHEMKLIAAQANTERERTTLTEEQTKLNRLEQQYKSGQITLQKFTTEIEKYESMIRQNQVAGSAEDAKHEAAFGQGKRWIRSLVPGINSVR